MSAIPILGVIFAFIVATFEAKFSDTSVILLSKYSKLLFMTSEDANEPYSISVNAIFAPFVNQSVINFIHFFVNIHDLFFHIPNF